MIQVKLTNKHKNRRGIELLGFSLFLSVALVGCGKQTASSNTSKTNTNGEIIQTVGAENEYADIIKQIGGKYVSVTSIMNDVGTDPHSYESNTKDSSAISNSTLIVQNGAGYDDFMDNLESSSNNTNRTIINVAKSLGYGDNTQNPHLWYKPDTMPKVAKLIAKNLESQKPEQKAYFENNLSKFTNSLKPLNNDLKQIKDHYSKAGVAVTEPVSDYILEAANLDIKTPWGYQASVMNGTDPSPQNVKMQEDLIKNKQVKVFIYNEQVINDSTTTLLKLARSNNIPIVGVYETMPPNHTYQTWMETEAQNILKALRDKVSTEKIS